MRIAIVSEHASPLAVLGGADAGGQNVAVAALATGLAERGVDVTVHTRRDDLSLPRRAPLTAGVTVDHVSAGPPEPMGKDLLLPYIDEFTVDLYRQWSAERPHVVHSHFWMSGCAAVRAVFTAAGIDYPAPLGDLTGESWDRIIAVNLLGTAAVVRAALPYLRSSNGIVVTCASTLGFRAVPDATAYCASKWGVVGFTRALAAELKGAVRVTMLVPGGMYTSFFDGRDERYKPPQDAKLNHPEDVARSVLVAMGQPPGCEIKELVVTSSWEGSWP